MKATSFDAVSTEVRREAHRRATRPQRAASLILVDRVGAEPRVLMGRRHAGASFMPGRWVFPGGRCDRTDARVASASELSDATLERLGRASRTTASAARALAMAAIRETFEETGLRLARPATPPQAPWADLAALRFVARAITPPALARRFDTHFFEADADGLDAREPRPCAELDEVAWLSLAETATVETAGVTRLILAEIAPRLTDPTRPPLLIRLVRGRREVRALDGECMGERPLFERS